MSSLTNRSPSQHIQVSNAVTVDETTTIRDCVRTMKRKNAGSVLVTRQGDFEELVGIFTERDILRNIDISEKWNGWDRPVSRVMTRNVQTIRIAQLPRAAQMMIRGGFRHLPIIERSNSGKLKIVGVVSMRDLLEFYVNREDVQRKEYHKDRQIGVLSSELSHLKLFKEAFSFSPRVSVRPIKFKFGSEILDVVEEMYGSSVVFVDIDFLSIVEWSSLFKKVNRDPNVGHVFISFHSDRYSAVHRKLIYQLSRSRKFSVYSKPLNAIGLITEVRDFIEK